MSDIAFVALAYLAALGPIVLYAAALESRIRRTKARGRSLEEIDSQGEALVSHPTAKG